MCNLTTKIHGNYTWSISLYNFLINFAFVYEKLLITSVILK